MSAPDRYLLAQAHLDGGDPLRALATLDPVHDEVGATAAGLLLLGRGYCHSVQLERAQDAFERLVAADPTDAYARFLPGRTLERRSRPAQAQVHCRVAVALSADPEYRERLALVTGRLDGLAGRAGEVRAVSTWPGARRRH